MADLVHLKTIDCQQGAVRAVRFNGKLLNGEFTRKIC